MANAARALEIKGSTVEQLQKLDETKREYNDREADRKQAEKDRHQERIQVESDLAKFRESKTGAGAKIPFQEQKAANIMNTTMNEAGISMENLSQLTEQGKIHTTSGMYDNISDHGVFGATSKAMGQGLTNQNKQMYTSIMLPLARMSSVAFGGGYYKVNDAAVRQSIESFIAQPGQTHMTMLEKIAELKQTLIQSAKSSLEAGKLNDAQSTSMLNNIDKIEKSIPWNVSDVIDFYHKGGKAEDFGAYLKKNTKSDDESKWKDM